jgi:hypothetical protein
MPKRTSSSTLKATSAAALRPENRPAAKERYERGIELFKQELYGPALAEMLEARRLYPTWSSTLIAARCLKALGRFDESLDMYAILVRDYSVRLQDPKEKGERYKAVLNEIAELRKLVGAIEIDKTETGATIVVDGRVRGLFPLLEPVRVPAGSHMVRVFKQGYEAVETRIEVAGGTSERVEAPLQRLVAMGTLQVVEAKGRTVDVYVDNFPIGKTPLSMPIAPGKHMVFLRGEDGLGTQPTLVAVRADDLAPLRLEAEPMTAALKIVPTPSDALLAIDSIELGRGAWDGYLRPGEHTVEVAAEGFLPEKRTIRIRADKPTVLPVPLLRDPRSPFWRPPPLPPHFVIELDAALGITPTVGGDVATLCTGDCTSSVGLGSYFSLRGGYELGSRLSFGLVFGEMNAKQAIEGRTTQLFVVGLNDADQGTLDHEITLRAAFAGAWVGYSFDTHFPVRLRLSAGGAWGRASDARRGIFSAQISPGDRIGVGTLVEKQSASFVFVTPEVRVGFPLRRGVEISAGVELPIWFAVEEPAWSSGHAVDAGVDGYGWFASETFLDDALVLIAPSIGAKFDF